MPNVKTRIRPIKKAKLAKGAPAVKAAPPALGAVARKVAMNQSQSVWAGPGGAGPQGGVTQSMLGRYLTCKERFRIHAIEGLHSADRFSPMLANLSPSIERVHHLRIINPGNPQGFPDPPAMLRGEQSSPASRAINPDREEA